MFQNRILQVSKLAIHEGRVNCQKHSLKQEVFNETTLDISDTQRIFSLPTSNSKHIKEIIRWPQEGGGKT